MLAWVTVGLVVSYFMNQATTSHAVAVAEQKVVLVAGRIGVLEFEDLTEGQVELRQELRKKGFTVQLICATPLVEEVQGIVDRYREALAESDELHRYASLNESARQLPDGRSVVEVQLVWDGG
jgi:hypothetical protein